MDIRKQLQAFIGREGLFMPGGRILVAVSGGADSIALLHLLKEAGFDLAVAHVNFQLRGADSDGDEAFVAGEAERLGLACYVQRFPTEKLSQETGESIQMLARRLRYEWFAQLLDEGKGNWLATAHHANDTIETALFNLAKGTGLAGLCGIAPIQGKVVRPLLFASKEDLLNYLKINNLNWREDVSNSTDKYLRNYIRHHAVPALLHVNPSLAHTSVGTFDRLRQAWALVKDAQEAWVSQYVRHEGDYWLLQAEALAHPQASMLLHEWLKRFGFAYEQCQSIVSENFEAGKAFHAGKHSFWRVPTGWILTEHAAGARNEHVRIAIDDKEGEGLGLRWVVEMVPYHEAMRPENANIGMFDRKKLHFPLTLRYWEAGDRIRPLGMKGQKKVSDLLNDAKVPAVQKETVPVLVDASGTIIWVVGHRIADAVKLGEQTKEVWAIATKPLI